MEAQYDHPESYENTNTERCMKNENSDTHTMVTIGI